MTVEEDWRISAGGLTDVYEGQLLLMQGTFKQRNGWYGSRGDVRQRSEHENKNSFGFV